MTTNLENVSISMGLSNWRAFNLSDAEVFIQRMEDVVSPAILLPQKHLQILICVESLLTFGTLVFVCVDSLVGSKG